MVTVFRVHNFVACHLKFLAISWHLSDAENELTELEKSLEKDGDGELEVRRPTK